MRAPWAWAISTWWPATENRNVYYRRCCRWCQWCRWRRWFRWRWGNYVDVNTSTSSRLELLTSAHPPGRIPSRLSIFWANKPRPSRKKARVSFISKLELIRELFSLVIRTGQLTYQNQFCLELFESWLRFKRGAKAQTIGTKETGP